MPNSKSPKRRTFDLVLGTIGLAISLVGCLSDSHALAVIGLVFTAACWGIDYGLSDRG